MKAVVIDEFVSNLAHLKVKETPSPRQTSTRNVRVKITHAAVTHVDMLYAQGLHQNNRRHVQPPFILGTEYAGIVTSSPPTSAFKPGTRVFGGSLGSFAEEICVDEGDMRKVPDQWSNAEACAVGSSGAVSWGSLISVADLKAGETVLILGASGGLGVMAVQIAKAVGAKVIAVVGDKEKAAMIRDVGADEVVDYHDERWEEKVRSLTDDGEGVHVVYDAIGAVESSLKCLRYRGRVVVVGFAARGGKMEEIRTNRILLKSAMVHGYRFGEDGRHDPQRIRDVWNGFMKMVESRSIKPVIYKEDYRGLEAVPSALDGLRTHKVWGRAILRINEEKGSGQRDDFNPEPMVDEDDVKPAAPPKRKPVATEDHDEDEDLDLTRKVDDEEEEDDEEGAGEDVENDDDDDDDEEDEDEDEVVARPHKRRKKTKRNMFVDVEAEVDDEEDEEEEGDDDVADEIHPEDDIDPTGADLDDRHHRELDIQRQHNAQKDAEDIARELDEKYRRREMQRAQKAAAGSVPMALPTVNDPSIWGVRCRPGKEREIIMAITKRIDEQVRVGLTPKVYSAFERGGGTGPMSGYLYVEADAKQDMVEIVEGIQNVFMGSGQIAIEVKERPDLLRKRKRAALEENGFVRMIRPPLYKGDLAKVVEVHPNGLDCTVQLVPRLDYGLGEDANAAGGDGNKRKRGGNFGRVTERPDQKLFSEQDAKKRHMKFLTMGGSTGQKTFTYKGDDYQNGYLIKDVKINFVTAENVKPTMEEMQLFAITSADGTETLDLVAVQAAQKAAQSGSTFVSGDSVEIYEGEQKGIRGTTVTVTGDIVTLRVSEGELTGRRIDAPVKTLRKLFRDGDHVKVIGGSKYIDEVGMVTRIKGDKITLLCDSTQSEITVFSKDLKRAADSATLGNDSDFELYDLVQIDASTVGCVIKVDREILRVVDQNGNVRSIIHSQVSSVVGRNKNAVATDRDGSEIRNDDTVKEHGGDGRQGKVIYIHRGILFIQNRELIENGGLFVTRSTNVATMAAKSGRAQATGPDLGALNPALQPQGTNGAGMAPPRSMGRDKLIGKTVIIRKGPYKGLLGIVKDTMNDDARIELHTKNKQVSVRKELLTVKDPITGNSMDFGGKFPNRARGGGFAGSTPNYSSGGGAGGRTPGWGNTSKSGPNWGAPAGGRTPGWGGGGGRTPGWGGDGGRTAYGGDGGRTAYGGATAYGGNDGSRTAYGGSGDGSRTAYGGATAYGGNDGSRTAYGGFNSGGRTPGGPSWGNSGSNSKSNLAAPTPAPYNAPTPGAYSAPTPGGYGAYSAPTPGGPPMDAPTPGNYAAPTPGDTSAQNPTRNYGGYGGGYGATPAAAPTPGAWAETPWGGAPETPAPSGEDPQYD
ncbi:hypothetical protein K504DRAFT_406959 [Pleomassaria siparia CBS 279.74]|uniref:Transcription elongation factor SPT5 n=1 Tax=Pleomassaria siparia CBS 279.74 TaxID=1314801 RepID=A0A6G1KAZ4_9PLEO|nr:hypothetical protein K504DRAFT_406959 [Pleomassaria siparia CBS 279.74]